MWNYKSKLTKIVIETKKSEKEASDGKTVYGPFNEGVSGSEEAIQSYVVCETEDTNCIGYLQGDGGIKLNSDSSHLFYKFANVTVIEGIENLDTSSVTDMSYMFHYMKNLRTLTFGENFNTSNVKNMRSMFSENSQLQELNISNFDTSSVTSMNSMFSLMSKIQSLDLSHFNTSSVKDMSSMFYNCSPLQELDLSSFNTSSVTDMSYMFQGMSNLQTLTFGNNFNTSIVTKMNSMFNEMINLQELDLSSFDTSSVITMSRMFKSASKLTKITYSSKFVHTDGMNIGEMFYGCYANKPDASVHSSREGVSFD